MPCSCDYSELAGELFNDKKVGKELKSYRRNGAGPTTRMLRDGLVDAGLARGSLLDIGSGIGALTFELLERGMTEATSIDASPASLVQARAEAERRALSDRVRFVHADFVDAAGQCQKATVVTLDRVICCYPFYEPLLEHALRLADRGFALSYPRERWLVRAYLWADNAKRGVRGCAFRTFMHPVARMQRVIQQAGFTLVSRHTTMIWTADVFARRAP
jgi:16S rRNA G966 N2-methylase RsmD